MPIRIDELTVPTGATPPEWFAPAAAQIAAMASDMAAQTKTLALLQQQFDELRALILRQINPEQDPVWFVLAGFALVALVHVAPFPFLLDRFAPAGAIWRMPADDRAPQVYLTFDDGPNPTATPELLDVLRATGARATFFLIDAHLSVETAPIVRRMFDEGHAVALHSDTRALMIKTPADLAETLTRQADRIERLAGTRPCRLFRPHAGWRSGSMFEGLRRIDYALVGWSFGLWDFNWYRRPDPLALATRLARRASPGDIVVMHDGHHVNPRADRRHTVTATRELIPALRARGFNLGTMC